MYGLSVHVKSSSQQPEREVVDTAAYIYNLYYDNEPYLRQMQLLVSEVI